jgi:hypothetical protein
MVVLACVALLVAVGGAVAAKPPTVSEDFTAKVVVR